MDREKDRERAKDSVLSAGTDDHNFRKNISVCLFILLPKTHNS